MKFSSTEDDPEANTELTAPEIGAGSAIPVQAETAQRGELIVSITASGRTRAIRQLALSVQVSSTVESLFVKEGSRVNANATLFTLDDADFLLEFREAEERMTTATIEYGEQLGEMIHSVIPNDGGEALLDLGKAEHLYYETLKSHQDGLVSRQNLQLVERELAAAKIFNEANKKTLVALRSGLTSALIDVEKAKLNLSRTRCVAPFAGYIGDVDISPGSQVAAGTECLTLVDLDRLLVDIEILESESALVKVGHTAHVNLTAFPAESFTGTVVSVNPLVDPEKKTRRATVVIQNPQHKALPGMYAAVQLEAHVYEDRLIVPKEAVVLRDQRPVVFIARTDPDSTLRAVWSYVDIGIQNDKFVEILSSRFDLEEGEKVVTSNHYTMIHDALIRIVE